MAVVFKDSTKTNTLRRTVVNRGRTHSSTIVSWTNTTLLQMRRRWIREDGHRAVTCTKGFQCFKCGDYGHVRAEWPRPRTYTATTTTTHQESSHLYKYLQTTLMMRRETLSLPTRLHQILVKRNSNNTTCRRPKHTRTHLTTMIGF